MPPIRRHGRYHSSKPSKRRNFNDAVQRAVEGLLPDLMETVAQRMQTELLPNLVQTVMHQINKEKDGPFNYDATPPYSPTPPRDPTPPHSPTPPRDPTPPRSPPKAYKKNSKIPPIVDIHKWLSRFQKQHPKSFSSAKTPIDAQNWIAHIEKIFEVLGVKDEFKTRLAAYKLEDNSQTWWSSVKLARGGDKFASTLPWDGFKTLFFQQYFPIAFKEEYIREFASIKQREDESMTEFMERFTRLASFVGPTMSPKEMAGKLKWALCERIKWLIVNQEFNDVTEVANAVQNLEIANKTMKLHYDGNLLKNLTMNVGQTSSQIPTTNSHKSNSNRNYSNQNESANRTSQNDKVVPQNRDPLPPCKTCGKIHAGVCLKITGGCYKCKQTGHSIQDCPYIQKTTGKSITTPATGANAIPSNSTGRVFALTLENKPTELAKKHHEYDVLGGREV